MCVQNGETQYFSPLSLYEAPWSHLNERGASTNPAFRTHSFSPLALCYRCPLSNNTHTSLQEILSLTLDTNCFSDWLSGWSFLSHFPTSADHNTCLTLSLQSNILKIDLQTSFGIVLANMSHFKKSKIYLLRHNNWRTWFFNSKVVKITILSSWYLSAQFNQLLFYFPLIFSNRALYLDTKARIIKTVMKLI